MGDEASAVGGIEIRLSVAFESRSYGTNKSSRAVRFRPGVNSQGTKLSRQSEI